ncbi:MAG: phage integrase N-terminal SAM-like domain-containing protein, partial [Flavobacteriales bacterium]|nr:phage integrase N-terminal SAM-like domain-containing protein [Flavobacteriales bacterium]
MQQHSVILKRELHREQDVLSIYMCADHNLNAIAKKLGARYSATKKMWWLPWKKQTVNTTFKAFKAKTRVDYSALKTETNAPSSSVNKAIPRRQTQTNVLKNFAWTQVQKDAMWAFANVLTVRKYSKRTFDMYGFRFKQFLKAHPNTDPKEITEEEIINHVIVTVKTHNYSAKTQNQIINAIKFYYEKVLKLEKKRYWLPRPRKETKLPVVISEEEVIRLLVALNNLKHQCIMGMLYSAGLRRGELIDLRIRDVNIDRGQIFVRGGKGNKDRVTLLSDRMV